MTTELPRNSMTILELTGPALETLRTDVATAGHTFRLAVEVEPDGTTYVKVKPDEYMWSPPLSAGATVRTERLYD